MDARRAHCRRLWRDLDALHALAVALVVLLGSGGLAYAAYFVHVLRVARRAGTRASGVLLVFGKHCRDGEPDADFLLRLQRAEALAATGTLERVLLLGGGEHPTEAETAARVLRARGWPAALPLVLEDESRDTLENLRHAQRLLGEAHAPVWLLSNRYHLARCLLLAACVGLPARACAAEPAWRFTRRAWTEAALTMWIDVGRRWARLIGHQRMLAKLDAAAPAP